jgi:hypothetical protein
MTQLLPPEQAAQAIRVLRYRAVAPRDNEVKLSRLLAVTVDNAFQAILTRLSGPAGLVPVCWKVISSHLAAAFGIECHDPQAVFFLPEDQICRWAGCRLDNISEYPLVAVLLYRGKVSGSMSLNPQPELTGITLVVDWRDPSDAPERFLVIHVTETGERFGSIDLPSGFREFLERCEAGSGRLSRWTDATVAEIAAGQEVLELLPAQLAQHLAN